MQLIFTSISRLSSSVFLRRAEPLKFQSTSAFRRQLCAEHAGISFALLAPFFPEFYFTNGVRLSSGNLFGSFEMRIIATHLKKKKKRRREESCDSRELFVISAFLFFSLFDIKWNGSTRKTWKNFIDILLFFYSQIYLRRCLHLS